MLFQTLDDKKECIGLYINRELDFSGTLPLGLSRTWSYSAFLEDLEVEYAKIYCGGITLDKACPEALRDRWTSTSEQLQAFIRSFHTARVSLHENCFFDLVPKKFLLEFCDIKNQICEYVFATHQKPANYDYLLELTKLIEQIKYQPLNINTANLSLFKSSHRKFAQKLKTISSFCNFNVYGTKTGRLTNFKHSFPILTLDKTLRGVLEPHNDYFIEIDFNAAELRTLLSLQGKSQPDEDMHAWNIKNVFNSQRLTRDEAKRRIFAWLYNPESDDKKCAHFYNREGVVRDYFEHGQVVTCFDKVIPSEERTALNYIIQSTCAENVLRQMIKVSNYLKDKKSFVAFPIHDSIVIDFSLEDRELLPEIIETFSATELGKFMTNISVGKNFGSMEKMRI